MRLAAAYSEGRGTDVNKDEAGKWYCESWEGLHRIAERGDKEALTILANFYQFRNNMDNEKDQAEALKWYRKATERGLSSAAGDIKRLEESKRQQCNGGILPPPRKRQRQAKAAWRFLHRSCTNTPLLLVRSAEAGCLRYIAGASLNTLFGYTFI